MQKYRRVHAQESTRLLPPARGCLNFFGQGSILFLHSSSDSIYHA